jgi:hypothetical protein
VLSSAKIKLHHKDARRSNLKSNSGASTFEDAKFVEYEGIMKKFCAVRRDVHPIISTSPAFEADMAVKALVL